MQLYVLYARLFGEKNTCASEQMVVLIGQGGNDVIRIKLPADTW